jgi:hypothetical protein
MIVFSRKKPILALSIFYGFLVPQSLKSRKPDSSSLLG